MPELDRPEKKHKRGERYNNGKKRKENAATKLIYKKERKFRGNIKKQYQTGQQQAKFNAKQF